MAHARQAPHQAENPDQDLEALQDPYLKERDQLQRGTVITGTMFAPKRNDTL